MSEGVAQGAGLGQVVVEMQGASDGSRNLGDLKGMGEPGHKRVTLGGDEHLSFVFQASEGVGVKDAVSVSLEL